MIFEKLELVGFRNYRRESFVFDPGLNILLGNNGQGKTNLIEAIFILSRGHSFRPAERESLIRRGDQQSLLKARLIEKNLRDDLSLRISALKSEAKLNNKTVHRGDVARKLPVILFSPESLASLKDGPEARRSLIDEFLWNRGPEHIDILHSFQKLLRSRNRLFKDYLKKRIAPVTFENTLQSLDELFFPIATRLTFERIESLKLLVPSLKEAYQKISDDKNVDISVDYEISGQSAMKFDYHQILNNLIERAQNLKAAEKDSGVSLVGPHKHDIRILVNQNDSRYYCSQGQQRALILAFKIAQMMYHQTILETHPILLLDDVLSELDLEKQNRLLSFLKQLNAQVFLTTTDLAKIEGVVGSEMRVLQISEGTIAKG